MKPTILRKYFFRIGHITMYFRSASSFRLPGFWLRLNTRNPWRIPYAFCRANIIYIGANRHIEKKSMYLDENWFRCKYHYIDIMVTSDIYKF